MKTEGMEQILVICLVAGDGRREENATVASRNNDREVCSGQTLTTVPLGDTFTRVSWLGLARVV